MINSLFMGWCDGVKVLTDLHKLKLEGRIMPGDCAVVMDGEMVHVQTSPGRPVRPLFVVDPATRKLVYKVKNLATTDPEELFREGAIELVDPYEQEGLPRGV